MANVCSFPCKQEGLAVGKLTNWTKGFKCSGVEGEDVVSLLKQALQRRGDVYIEVRPRPVPAWSGPPGSRKTRWPPPPPVITLMCLNW